MKNKQNQQESDQQRLAENLTVVYRKVKAVEFESDAKGIVTILLKQDHPIQRFFRKLHCHIPEYRRIKLDALSSFVFSHIDGCLTVEEIGNLVETQFGETAQPIFQRLFIFLNHMNHQCHYIEQVNK